MSGDSPMIWFGPMFYTISEGPHSRDQSIDGAPALPGKAVVTNIFRISGLYLQDRGIFADQCNKVAIQRRRGLLL
jgi:hypothetical protein